MAVRNDGLGGYRDYPDLDSDTSEIDDYVNNACESILKEIPKIATEDADVLRKKCEEIFRKFIDARQKDDREEIKRSINEIRSVTSPYIKDWRIELDDKDGSLILIRTAKRVNILCPNSDTECSVEKNTLKHFCATNHWEIDSENRKFEDTGEFMYIRDTLTGDLYLNESKFVIGGKLLLILLGNATGLVPLVYLIASFGYLIHHLSKGDFASAGWDFLRIVFLPLILSAFILIILGNFAEFLNARKIYATFERVIFNGNFVLAPCFQPQPKIHFFGGNISDQNAF